MDGLDITSAMEIMADLSIQDLEEVLIYALHKITSRSAAAIATEGGAEHAASDCA